MPAPLKPPALKPGAQICVVSPASPAEQGALDRGLAELTQLGFRPQLAEHAAGQHGYFAGSHKERWSDLTTSFSVGACDAVVCSRGGYGSTYLLDRVNASNFPATRILLGYSDVTALQAFLWQKLGWVTFYGPMVAAGFDKGAAGYDEPSFRSATCQAAGGWQIELQGESMVNGTAEGVVLGGCLTMIETTLGTPWELDTTDAILLLEDRGMKPFQVDRAVMHLRQAGKFAHVRAIVLGEFPECEAPVGSEDVRGMVGRFVKGWNVPVVWGAAIGHTARPMLTLPLGIRARLECDASRTQLSCLEPAVV